MVLLLLELLLSAFLTSLVLQLIVSIDKVNINTWLDAFILQVSGLALIKVGLSHLPVKELVNCLIHVVVELLDVGLLLALMHRLIDKGFDLVFDQFGDVVLLPGDQSPVHLFLEHDYLL